MLLLTAKREHIRKSNKASIPANQAKVQWLQSSFQKTTSPPAIKPMTMRNKERRMRTIQMIGKRTMLSAFPK